MMKLCYIIFWTVFGGFCLGGPFYLAYKYTPDPVIIGGLAVIATLLGLSGFCSTRQKERDQAIQCCVFGWFYLVVICLFSHYIGGHRIW